MGMILKNIISNSLLNSKLTVCSELHLLESTGEPLS